MNLIIVESPTKAKTLAKFLGSDYLIEASMGHIRDLPESKIGIDVDHDFTPDYVVSEKKKETVARLREQAAKADKIILATDPDREGEAISWHIANVLNIKNLARITFHEITKSAIDEALKNPGMINIPMVNAQQARRILDRLVGYKLSPLLWKKIRRGLSAGRVQSVAVRLLVEREKEIKAFNPVEYWEIEAKFTVHSSQFTAKLVKQEIPNKETADKFISILKNSEFKVESINSKEVKRSPYPPFITSTLQQTAANVLGWTAKKTMQIAQSLYEEGIITYHRTDSTNLAGEAMEAARVFINNEYGKNYVPVEPRFYKVKSRVAQEAHEAIRPTSLNQNFSNLERDHKRLFELIWKRFLACQMNDFVSLQTSVDITAATCLFRASGSCVLFDGWKTLYSSLDENEEKENKLPELKVSEVLKLSSLVSTQHFTEPPPRFNEASLIKALEEYGIGRPSTYAPIISTILERQYVEKEDRKLIPTSLGFAVTDFLVDNFGNILDYKFTASMEDDLDAIANGEKQWIPVIHEFYDPFSTRLVEVEKSASRVKVETEVTDELCPDCQSPLIVRIGKFGKFLACSKFPDCKYTAALIRKANIKCPKCQTGEVVIKKTKSKKTFFGCSNYPNCDFASWTKPKDGLLSTDNGLQKK